MNYFKPEDKPVKEAMTFGMWLALAGGIGILGGLLFLLWIFYGLFF